MSVWLRFEAGESIALASSNQALRTAMQREGIACVDDTVTEDTRWRTTVDDFSAFYRTLGRFAALARSLPNQVASRFAATTKGMPLSTEAERLVVQRIGQNLFRDALIDYWQGRCAITGLDVVPLLRASHIKPWAACASNAERLDVFNGLLLAPHLDALFDGGWITLQDDGELVVCSGLTAQQRLLFGIHAELRASSITDSHLEYLAFHRDRIFKK